MARFWIGTSGWTYRDWKGRFYPKGLPARQWLSYYGQCFQTVEINGTFYRQPRDETWDSWRSAAPEGFRFAVKAHRYLTHYRRLNDCEGPLDTVVKGARRLQEKLGPLLFQMPPGFVRNDESARRLEAFLDLLPPGLMAAFEFRDDSWFGEDTFRQLRRHSVAFCSYDMVGQKCPLVTTARFAYVRFHGSQALYGSRYTDEELAAWGKRLAVLAAGLDEVYAYFNNDTLAFAVANAQQLSRLLSSPALTH